MREPVYWLLKKALNCDKRDIEMYLLGRGVNANGESGLSEPFYLMNTTKYRACLKMTSHFIFAREPRGGINGI